MTEKRDNSALGAKGCTSASAPALGTMWNGFAGNGPPFFSPSRNTLVSELSLGDPLRAGPIF